MVGSDLAVQLVHDDDESNRADHGWVAVIGPDGAELCRHDDVQHNRNYSGRVALMERLADDAIAALAKTAGAEAEEADRQLSTVTEEIAAVTLTATTTEVEMEAGASCMLPPRKAAAAPLDPMDPMDGSAATRTTSG